MNPFDYFRFRYYEKWLGGISQFFLDSGYITRDEFDAVTAQSRRRLESGNAHLPQHEGRSGIDEQVLDYLRRGDSPRRDSAHARFAPGDHILITDTPADDHTRLPGFLRGKAGVVERVFEGDYAYFCSTGADGLGPAMPIYIVRFEHAHLWGARAEPNVGSLYAELFECYLLPMKVTT
jgi:nitrile hydratase